jgi:hypothetical protein
MNIEPSEPKETRMYRTVGMAIIALAAITLPAGTSLASSGGGKTTAHSGTQNPPKATPQTKKLSGKAGAACFRACMHGVSGASWGNFCDYSCYGR